MVGSGRKSDGTDGRGRKTKLANQRRGDDPERYGLGKAIAFAVDLLLTEGHRYKDVRFYSLPQLWLFVQLRNERIQRLNDAQEQAWEDAKKGSGSKEGAQNSFFGGVRPSKTGHVGGR